MADTRAFWNVWAPYWSDVENSYLDVATIRRLEPKIESPVLLVGAGQGLLVERLRKDGFHADGIDAEPAMIAYARKRRRLELIEADARTMPFADESYATVIVATGVVDFLDDDAAIRAILDETRRVARRSGHVFVAFHRMRARSEQALHALGMFVDDGRYYRMRAILRAEFESPRLFFRLAKIDKGLPFALRAFLKLQFLTRNLREAFVAATPELVPYRREAQIKQLFDRHGVPVHAIHAFETCIVVQLPSRTPGSALSYNARGGTSCR